MNNIYRKNLTKEVQDVYTENYKTYCNKFYKIYINRKKSFVNGLEDLSLRCQHSPNWYTDSLKFYQTPGAFFAGKKQTDPKIYNKMPRTPDSKKLFRNTNKVGRLTFPILKPTTKLQ